MIASTIMMIKITTRIKNVNTIKITKMQGCGNDFVIIDYTEYEKTGLPMETLAKKICDRNFGVGADGLIIPKTDTSDTDIGWYFFNSDGSTAQMCGNGMRCFAKYAYDNKLVNKKEFSVQTLAGVIKPKLLDDGFVRVNMGNPILEHAKIPFRGLNTVIVNGREFDIFPVSMGNPHCIIFTDKNVAELAKSEGSKIETSSLFPEKTNVEFINVINKNKIKLDVWERGCGITLACGTGACASVVAGIKKGLLDNKVEVILPGGVLKIEYQGKGSVYMTGGAEKVFEGVYFNG